MNRTPPVTRRDALKMLGAGAATLALADLMGCAGGSPSKRPNIVFVLSDDHRFDAMGCAGDPRLETPNFDRLAAEGVRFTNAFVTTSLCSPSRACFLTGAHTHQHGVRDNMNRDPMLPIFPEVLQQAGYETAYIGKWHMLARATPRRGFDHWVSFNGQGEYLRNTMNVDGQWSLCLNYITDELTDRALAFIGREHTGPFLLYLSHKAPHAPLVPAARHRTRYADVPFATFNDADDQLATKPDWGGRRPGSVTEEELRDYHRCVLAVDESVGRVVSALKERGILDETIFIYASDNGLMFGEHGGLRDKRAAFEPSIRIPLLMRYPRLARKGRTCDEMVLGIDLAPTLLQAAGVAIPSTVQGRSWLPLLDGETGRDDFLYEYFREAGPVPTCLAVRSHTWKYVTYPEDPALPPELYDLKNDPGELINLAGQPPHAATQQQMALRLVALLRDSGYTSPPPG